MLVPTTFLIERLRDSFAALWTTAFGAGPFLWLFAVKQPFALSPTLVHGDLTFDDDFATDVTAKMVAPVAAFDPETQEHIILMGQALPVPLFVAEHMTANSNYGFVIAKPDQTDVRAAFAQPDPITLQGLGQALLFPELSFRFTNSIFRF